MARRQRGEGAVFQRHDHASCPPLEDGPPGKDGKPTRVRPDHKCRGKWVGRVDLGGGKRRTIYARTQAAAIKEVRSAQRDKEAGNLSTRGQTLEKWLTYWLDAVCPSKTTKAGAPLKPKTLRNYRSYVETKLVPHLGKKRLDRLEIADVRGLSRWITAPKPAGLGLSSTTAMHAHRILGEALNDAIREGRLSRNVVELTPTPAKAATVVDSLTMPQFAALMRHLDGDPMQSRWAFALFTGARQGECLGLTWANLDLENGIADLAWQLQRIPYKHGCGRQAGEWSCGRKRPDRCHARELDVLPGFDYRHLDGNLCLQRPKTKGSTRVIPLPSMLVVALKERRAIYEDERRGYVRDHGLVWARTDGRPIDGRQDWADWAAHLEALNIGHMKLHSARHTASTVMQALNVPENIRMAILGHSEAATNRLYTRVDLTTARSAMDTYGAAIAELMPSDSHE